MWKKVHTFLGIVAFVAFLILACTGCTRGQQTSNQNEGEKKVCAHHGGVRKIAKKHIDLGTRLKIEFVTTYFVCGDGKVESFHMLTAHPNI